MGTDNILPDVSTATSKENKGGTGLKYLVVERVFHLLQLLLANESTRLEIFERLASYYKVDNFAISSDSSSRCLHRMFERDIKQLEALGLEIRKVKGKEKSKRYSLVKG